MLSSLDCSAVSLPEAGHDNLQSQECGACVGGDVLHNGEAWEALVRDGRLRTDILLHRKSPVDALLPPAQQYWPTSKSYSKVRTFLLIQKYVHMLSNPSPCSMYIAGRKLFMLPSSLTHIRTYVRMYTNITVETCSEPCAYVHTWHVLWLIPPTIL